MVLLGEALFECCSGCDMGCELGDAGFTVTSGCCEVDEEGDKSDGHTRSSSWYRWLEN